MDELDVMNGIAPLETEPLVHHVPVEQRTVPSGTAEGESPAEEYNRVTDIEKLLELYHWKKDHKAADGNQHWTRPGKGGGTSATTKDGLFYVFTSTDPRFEARKGYNAFQTYARLEHNGDESAAATAIVKRRPRIKYRGPKEAAAATAPNGAVESSGGHPPVESGGQIAHVESGGGIRHVDKTALKASELWAMKTDADPGCLIGNRFICRGSAVLWAGETGVGKSAALMQAVVSWKLGESFFGMTPTGPQSALVVQAENDNYDLAEAFQGVVKGLKLEHRLPELDNGIHFIEEYELAGEGFIRGLEAYVIKYKPDHVWIDNLFSFLGGDVSDQATASKFCRNGLNPIAKRHGCAIHLIHHTPRPPRDTRFKHDNVNNSYAGHGSAELMNWARAIVNLSKRDDGGFVLSAPKRGMRSGLLETRTSSFPRNIAYIEHGTEGICWQWSDRHPDQDEMDARQSEAAEVFREIGTTAVSWRKVIDIIKDKLGKKADSTAGLFFNKHVKPGLRYSQGTKLYTVKNS